MQHAQTHTKMRDQIISISKPGNTVVVLRHADRNKIPDGEFGNHVLLNDIGIKNSIAFGRDLRTLSIAKIVSSPIQRCIQTAEYIIEGYGRPVTINTSRYLGDPGMHVTDAEAAGNYYLKHGGFAMLEKFIQGEPVPGMPTQHDFRRDFSQYLKEESNEKGLTLMITHDFLIAVADYTLNNKSYTPETWVGYLNGFIFKST